ncbi:type II toxin-antitoxin system RelE/ParE family toxin [Nitrospiraceae bacterium AH_259_D15_M11_P09]|nr:type II toxin-antitoxin system RelE/ParE family toxin [Nitrospiraceae bacterium AH_259_D15_M11_P09]
MGSYEIRWKRSAERELRKHDRQVILRIIPAVEELANEPFPRQCRKLYGAEHQYRLRVGDYQVIYEVDVNAKTIVVQHVRHRSETYRRT